MVSVTIDLLMKCSPRFRAGGSDRENGIDGEVGDHSLSPNVSPKVRDKCVDTDLLFDAIFSQSTPLALKLGEHFMSTSLVTVPSAAAVSALAAAAGRPQAATAGRRRRPPPQAAAAGRPPPHGDRRAAVGGRRPCVGDENSMLAAGRRGRGSAPGFWRN